MNDFPSHWVRLDQITTDKSRLCTSFWYILPILIVELYSSFGGQSHQLLFIVWPEWWVAAEHDIGYNTERKLAVLQQNVALATRWTKCQRACRAQHSSALQAQHNQSFLLKSAIADQTYLSVSRCSYASEDVVRCCWKYWHPKVYYYNVTIHFAWAVQNVLWSALRISEADAQVCDQHVQTWGLDERCHVRADISLLVGSI